MSAKARVEVYRMADGYVNSNTACHVVSALRMANRVVEVEWREGHLCFMATYPVPRSVRIPAKPERGAKS